MAEAKKATAAKKTFKVRTDADLKAGGKNEKLVLASRKAFILGGKSNFAGVPALAGKKYPGGIGYRINKPDGTIMRLSSDSDAFKKLVSSAKAAIPDLIESKYTDKVKAFITDLVTTSAPGGGRTSDMSVLKGLDL